jgi:hypothetical protein
LIAIDLGNVDSICNISLQWDAVAYGKDFLLQVSNDSTNWTTVQSISSNIHNTNSINVKTAARYVRMYATAGNSSSGFSLKNLQFMAL